MIIYRCSKCNTSFLNGVDLSNHLENAHQKIQTAEDKKCPHCESEKVSFIAKQFDGDKEMHHIYYCASCEKALKIYIS
jgi:DNA-directed RNA polymerase subunit M/transcription elongation factor TFIIS